VIHRDRRRALSFGEDAAQYDRARPTYPAALVDDLMRGAPTRVLDVGCGTGIAGQLFADRGCQVLGVEADLRMATLARRRGLDVEVAAFEAWDPAARSFDLVVSGQAWHWVDPVVGPAKAGGVLRPGGRLAAFWNWGKLEPDVQVALTEIYTRRAPDLIEDSDPLGTMNDRNSQDEVAAIGASGLFEAAEVHNYAWELPYTTAEWLDKLPTHSDHRVLPPEQLAVLLDAVGAAVDGLGGSITVRYATRLVTARRLTDETR
jgi:SAM-dependent methyltransferase